MDHSCYGIQTVQLNGAELVIAVDHDHAKFQHSVLLVQDTRGSWTSCTLTDCPKYYAADWSVHIGDDPDWNKNPTCSEDRYLAKDYEDFVE